MAEKGHMGWQKVSGYTSRAKVETGHPAMETGDR